MISNQISVYKSPEHVVTCLSVDNGSAVTAYIPFLNEKCITINQTSKNEHVPEVKRVGRTLKERVRADDKHISESK